MVKRVDKMNERHDEKSMRDVAKLGKITAARAELIKFNMGAKGLK